MLTMRWTRPPRCRKTLPRKPRRRIRRQPGGSADLEDPAGFGAGAARNRHRGRLAGGAECNRAFGTDALVAGRPAGVRVPADGYPTGTCGPDERQSPADVKRSAWRRSHRDGARAARIEAGLAIAPTRRSRPDQRTRKRKPGPGHGLGTVLLRREVPTAWRR